MKRTVDRDRCMKSGQCQYLQPDLLGTDDDGLTSSQDWEHVEKTSKSVWQSPTHPRSINRI